MVDWSGLTTQLLRWSANMHHGTLVCKQAWRDTVLFWYYRCYCNCKQPERQLTQIITMETAWQPSDHLRCYKQVTSSEGLKFTDVQMFHGYYLQMFLLCKVNGYYQPRSLLSGDLSQPRFWGLLYHNKAYGNQCVNNIIYAIGVCTHCWK